MDISRESKQVLEAYGAQPGESSLANNCLLARRLVESGVRYVQLFDWGWDYHGTGADTGLTDGLTKKCATMDKPVAALIKDLRQRGLLDDTLVVGVVNSDGHLFGKGVPRKVRYSAATTIPTVLRCGWPAAG